MNIFRPKVGGHEGLQLPDFSGPLPLSGPTAGERAQAFLKDLELIKAEYPTGSRENIREIFDKITEAGRSHGFELGYCVDIYKSHEGFLDEFHILIDNAASRIVSCSTAEDAVKETYQKLEERMSQAAA